MGSGYLFSKPVICFVMPRLKPFFQLFSYYVQEVKKQYQKMLFERSRNQIVEKVKARFSGSEILRPIVKPWYQISCSSREYQDLRQID